MKSPSPSRRSFFTLALLGLLCVQAPLGHAEPIKHRGHIQSIDLDEKTIVLDKKKGEQTLTWDDATRVKSPVTKEISGLKPGMFVLCFVNEDGRTIKTVRHDPEQDKLAEETP